MKEIENGKLENKVLPDSADQSKKESKVLEQEAQLSKEKKGNSESLKQAADVDKQVMIHVPLFCIRINTYNTSIP